MVEMVQPDFEKRAVLKKWFSSEEFLHEYSYDGEDLGAAWQEDGTLFKVWAPTAEAVLLKLYAFGSKEEYLEKEEGEETAAFYPMERGEKGTWSIWVNGNLEGVYYTFLVTVEGVQRETGDPYARACGVNGNRSMVVDLGRTNPNGWEQDRRPEGIERHPVIYELHIQDFSYDWHSGVEDRWRGKYLAFTQEGTSLDREGEFPSCLSYLKQLGITYVHLLPTFDFGSVDEQASGKEAFNWGYDPMNYNAPEGSYATDPFDGHVRILEFKQMVMALHQAGIGVIMDVVFNHTYHLDGALQRMVPDYYYRIYEDGSYANGSACGNDTASERVMFRRFMADSVCYWAAEYHIDGFRFDLMGLHDVETMNTIRRRLNQLPNGEKILMYGEPWAADHTAMELGAIPAVAQNVHYLDPGIAIFSDIVRDAVKGNIFIAEHKGYVNGNREDSLRETEKIRDSVCALCGSHYTGKVRPLAPSQVINYVSAHDDRTLWDKLVVSVKKEAEYGKNENDILQMNKMAAGIVFTCLGIPFFQAGEEFARTKYGCSNSYNRSPKLNQLDWKRAKEYAELVEYYRFLIAMRRELPVLERLDAAAVEQVSFLNMESSVCWNKKSELLLKEEPDFLLKKEPNLVLEKESELLLEEEPDSLLKKEPNFVLEKESELLLEEESDSLLEKEPESNLFLNKETALIGFVLEDGAASGKWRKALVYYNPYSCIQQVKLPKGSWRILTDGVKRWSLDGLELVEGFLLLQARSVTVLGFEREEVR